MHNCISYPLQGFSPLEVHTIGLVADEHHSAEEEAKISSSSGRMRLLGTLLQEAVVSRMEHWTPGS